MSRPESGAFAEIQQRSQAQQPEDIRQFRTFEQQGADDPAEILPVLVAFEGSPVLPIQTIIDFPKPLGRGEKRLRIIDQFNVTVGVNHRGDPP